MSELTYPDDRKYTSQHEWAKLDDDVVRVGITAFAQDQLGDVVYVDLPAPGSRVEAGKPFGEVESTKSVSDLYAPLSGEIVEKNELLEHNPGLVNAEPYGDGWMVAIKPDDAAALDGLLTPDDYRASVQG